MAQLAIKGHSTRGKEVIEILEMLGGRNSNNCYGTNIIRTYFINENGYIESYFITHKFDYQFTLEEFLEKFPYKVGDKVQHKGATSCGSVFEVEKMRWVGTHVEYTVKRLWYHNGYSVVTAKDLQPFEEETMEENLTIQDIRDNNAEWLLKKLREMPAEGTLRTISDLYDELHKPQYPKTYEKCCEVVGAQSTRHWLYTIKDKRDYPHEIKIINYLDALRQLLICREAYWKIAGDWKPNFGETFIYAIGEYYGVVEKLSVTGKRILVFPTEEMRDAFYDNFKELIEQCKDLL